MNDQLPTEVIGAIIARKVYAPFGRDDLRRYAKASGDFNPLHLDPVFAREAGFDDVIVHGMLGMAVLGRLLSDSLPSFRIQRFRSRFKNIIPLGQPITCTARLEQFNEHTAILALIATAGTDDQVVIEGSATLAQNLGSEIGRRP